MFWVYWAEAALNNLTRVWIDADAGSRRLITAANSLIEKGLRRDPLSIGESRPGGRRIDFVYPLGYVFCVYEGERIVHVLDVWRIDH